MDQEVHQTQRQRLNPRSFYENFFYSSTVSCRGDGRPENGRRHLCGGENMLKEVFDEGGRAGLEESEIDGLRVPHDKS